MHIAWSWIWTLITVSISCDDKDYTTCALSQQTAIDTQQTGRSLRENTRGNVLSDKLVISVKATGDKWFHKEMRRDDWWLLRAVATDNPISSSTLKTSRIGDSFRQILS